MRRTKSVLALVAVMAAMLLVFATPALADKGDHTGKNNNGDHRDNNNGDHNDCCDNDANLIFVSDNDLRFSTFGFNYFDDFGCWEWSWVFEEWEWEEDCD